MALYSHWNWNTLQYDYYEGLGDRPGESVSVPASTPAGIALEAALPRIPGGALRVGSGKQAKGRIGALACDVGGLGAYPLDTAEQTSVIITMGAVLAGLGLLWYVTR